METDVLKIFNAEMINLGINYDYMEYKGGLVYPYIVGELTEDDYVYEDGSTRGEMLLTIFNRGSELDLVNIKELIKEKFKDYRAITDNGSIYIVYTRKLPIQSGEADLQKTEIYLDVRFWKGE
jgi:hypothetical protein